MEETSEGQRWGKGHLCGGPSRDQCPPKPEVPVPEKVPFSPMSLVLLLMATSWLFLTHCSWECLQIDKNAAKECTGFSIYFFVCTQTAGPQPLSQLCTSYSFFFFPCSRKTQSTFSWILLTPPFMPASKFSYLSAKALWNSCLVSSRIYQQKHSHHSRHGWAWDMTILRETAAADTALCCEQLVFMSYIIAETLWYH